MTSLAIFETSKTICDAVKKTTGASDDGAWRAGGRLRYIVMVLQESSTSCDEVLGDGIHVLCRVLYGRSGMYEDHGLVFWC